LPTELELFGASELEVLWGTLLTTAVPALYDENDINLPCIDVYYRAIVFALYPTMNWYSGWKDMYFWPAIVVSVSVLELKHLSLSTDALFLLAQPYFVGRSTMGTLTFTSVNILIVNTAKINIGKANGVAASMGGLNKALGPAIATNLFAFTSNLGYSFPFNYWFSFLFLSVTLAAVVAVSIALPARVGFKSAFDKK
jgi:hypothetical protein